MSAALRIRRALAVIAVALALVAFLAFGALAQQEDGDMCQNVDDYQGCIEGWIEWCVEVEEFDLCEATDG